MVTPVETIEAGLATVMRRAGSPGAIAGLARLSGGANMESWAFSCGEEEFVLRRAPSAEMMAGRPMSHAAEAAVIRAARAAGVVAPEVVAELEPGDGLGSGFIMRRIAGTADPKVVLGEGGSAMLADIAASLAAVHRVEPRAAGAIPALDAAGGVEGLAAQFESFGGDRPIIALGLAWLRANLPPPIAPRLVHGDLRIGNVMAEHGRLTGVLDWEVAHLGDFHEDLAFGCLTVWRFGQLDKPGFGLGTLEELFAAYEAAGGAPVDPARFRFWLIYRTVWWALGCLGMGGLWRSHADRSLERVVVARRTSEQELDLLVLLEEDAPQAERDAPLPPPPAPAPPPHGEPDAAEVLTAVSEWLGSVKERFSGRDRFDLAVARNALGIVVRELATRPCPEDRPLATDILAGRQSLATPGLLARLRRGALDKLAADVPKYAALAPARAKWEGPR
ncbi:phosphotransferase [Novosphingobium tardum]|uniref:Phosphotransferase n=1 Tax=Novosphingobium tardum TaxID=1538021 RepID=A0ABV8RJX4_9SPHN